MTTKDTKKTKYTEGIGRRKTSIARVRLASAKTTAYQVNGKSLEDYFKTPELRNIVTSALADSKDKFSITVKVYGGGINSQAESIRLGIARAMIELDETLRKELKKKGFLKRDPRSKERRKFGLKKARKRGQWSKR